MGSVFYGSKGLRRRTPWPLLEIKGSNLKRSAARARIASLNQPPPERPGRRPTQARRVGNRSSRIIGEIPPVPDPLGFAAAEGDGSGSRRRRPQGSGGVLNEHAYPDSSCASPAASACSSWAANQSMSPALKAERASSHSIAESSA